jgi:hypothetical protein
MSVLRVAQRWEEWLFGRENTRRSFLVEKLLAGPQEGQVPRTGSNRARPLSLQNSTSESARRTYGFLSSIPRPDRYPNDDSQKDE